MSKIKSHTDAVDYFEELPFYDKPIEKPKVKPLKNIYHLVELPFYEELSVIKKQIKGLEECNVYKVEIVK